MLGNGGCGLRSVGRVDQLERLRHLGAMFFGQEHEGKQYRLHGIVQSRKKKTGRYALHRALRAERTKPARPRRGTPSKGLPAAMASSTSGGRRRRGLRGGLLPEGPHARVAAT